jgi:hypothetical protein
LKELKKTRLAEAFERHCTVEITPARVPGMADLQVPNRRKRR